MTAIVVNLETGEQDTIPADPQDVAALQAAEAERLAAMTYAERRAAEYPPYTDYLDGIVKNDSAQIEAYVAACLAVKAKYPKP